MWTRVSRRAWPEVCLLAGLCAASGPLPADVRRTVDPETGLIGWKLAQAGVELELIQRLPDQTRAFLMARGFSRPVADALARACIFQTIFRNKGSSAARVGLRDWEIRQGDARRPLRLKEDWDRSWTNEQVSKPARLAFRWATFPTAQTFQTGDYNWGMISFGPPPGTRFDLHVVWHARGKTHRIWMNDLICAEDR